MPSRTASAGAGAGAKVKALVCDAEFERSALRMYRQFVYANRISNANRCATRCLQTLRETTLRAIALRCRMRDYARLNVREYEMHRLVMDKFHVWAQGRVRFSSSLLSSESDPWHADGTLLMDRDIVVSTLSFVTILRDGTFVIQDNNKSSVVEIRRIELSESLIRYIFKNGRAATREALFQTASVFSRLPRELKRQITRDIMY